VIKAKSVTTNGEGLPMGDIRHPNAKRRNIPPAKIAAEGVVPVIPKAQYAYNPHLPPVLRFDQHGKPDALPELLDKARRGPLSDDEARVLAEALRIHEPWLEWTGKREKPGFAVDPVALHIHERISAQAILKVAARQDASKFLFADPEQEYHEAVQFYRHDVDWANRLILGDSLQVMSSLAQREDLAGKVQMIYMDPPYGIKFASNFQPEVGKRDVKDRQEDLTREPEMVRAYRDTWHLGIHSYLSYLRDRLVVAKELLADSGSIFVQISDENEHRVRHLLDEVFGAHNFVGLIAFVKTGGFGSSETLKGVADYLLWYSRNRDAMQLRQLFSTKAVDEGQSDKYNTIELPSGERRTFAQLGIERGDELPPGARVLREDNATSQANPEHPIDFDGREFSQSWKTNPVGLKRLRDAQRLAGAKNTLGFVRYIDDFPATQLTNVWTDIGGIQSRADAKVYVVQTATEAVKRCMLMTTDPGDLVLDPTCGSGTTAYVAEQWGRRWITIDTSRVAVAIARQRLLTAKFDSYKTRATRKDSRGQDVPDPSSGFHYRTVPHITLKSIAQNVALDPIFARHEPVLDAVLKKANAELVTAVKKDPSLRARLAAKLAKKEKDEGKRAVTDADRRRRVLPPDNREKGVKYTVDAKFDGWYHWEVPFDTDPDWPKPLAEAVTAYRAAWRAKMDEVNACIAASAEQEQLVDQPEVVRGVTRVSGPFSVEAVQPPAMTLGEAMDAGPEFSGAPEDIKDTFEVRMVEATGSLEVANVGAYLDQMIRFLRADGVRFLNNKQMKWMRLEPLYESGKSSGFHAEGRWVAVGDEDRDPDGSNNVGVVFGPQYGPVTAKMVEELIKPAGRLYDHLVVAAFNFTAEAQAILNEGGGAPHPKLKIHFAHIRPDINPGMNGLLKESVSPGGGQLFTVFGQPRVRVDSRKGDDGKPEYAVTMEGVDVYNPVDNSINSTGASKVAAWFLDGDYDGRTFCVTQAFFPDKSAWEKLQKALNGKDGPIDAERFEAFSSTTSLPFPAGRHKCAAVKVIDPRGNEVMSVHRLA
jgi:adenine-specific DNA-methyltransferase